MYKKYAELRDKTGVTDYEVGKQTGIATSTLSNWKAGRYIPKTDKLQKIANYFGVSIEFLMGTEEKEDSPVYYTKEETAKLAQEMFEDEDMRSLFHMKRNMPPDRFKAHMEFMKNLYNQEKGENF